MSCGWGSVYMFQKLFMYLHVCFKNSVIVIQYSQLVMLSKALLILSLVQNLYGHVAFEKREDASAFLRVKRSWFDNFSVGQLTTASIPQTTERSQLDWFRRIVNQI